MRKINQVLVKKQRNEAELIFQAGVALQSKGRYAEAITKYQAVVKLVPTHLMALNNLAISLNTLGERGAAIEIYRAAIKWHPAVPQLHRNLANALIQLGRIDDAIAALKQALLLKPDYANACYGLATLFDRVGDQEQCRAGLQRTLLMDPNHFEAHLQLLARYDLPLCNFDNTECHHAFLVANMAAYASTTSADGVEVLLNLGYLNLFTSFPRTPMRDLARRASALLESVAAPVALGPRSLDPKRRIRIGYVSPNFSDHPVGHVTRTLFAKHDRSQVEVYAYATGKKQRGSGGYFSTICAGVDNFVEIDTMSAMDAAKRIAQDAIDILVDLDGYMELRSPLIFAHRPAPIQVFWLGHAGGLGFKFMDYVIADSVVVPPGEEAEFTESIVRLPEVYHVTDRAPISQLIPSRASQELEDGAFVFCAFNNPSKIDRCIFSAWMRILAAVPRSVLWLSAPTRYGDHKENLRQQAMAAGVDPKRLIFASRVPDKSVHLARHRLADLFLDTTTVNAATTALDALWAGLPVLTCKGDRFANRMAETFLKAMGLDELIAPTLDAYVERAVFLAYDRHARETLRYRVEVQRNTSPLFDTERFSHHIETGFRMMWQRYVAGLQPEHMNVPLLQSKAA